MSRHLVDDPARSGDSTPGLTVRGAVMLALGAMLFSFAAPAQSDPPNADLLCADDAEETSVERLIRAWSLEVRGTPPTLAEYERVHLGEAPEALLDEWLASPEFADRVVRRHRQLFWPNLGDVRVLESTNRLSTTEGSPYFREGIAANYRGGRVPCIEEPAEFDALGRPVAWPQEDGTRREGYVEVQPWWDPQVTLEVCAFDAQEAAVSPAGSSCDTQDGWNDVDCGCGPGLRWCWGGNFDAMVRESFAEDLEHRIRAMVTEDAPYTDLLLDRTQWINGPIAYFWRHLAEQGRQRGTWSSPVPDERLPDLAWDASDTWVAVEGGPEHSGVLTSPAWLLRFQTRRSRANRFYSSLLCTPFSPPLGGIQATEDETAYTLDLQVRDGCDYCHAQLEPAASAWGRWGEGGLRFLSPEAFPPLREDCLRCAETGSSCAQECRSDYVVDALSIEEEPYLGMLRAYEFRRPEHQGIVEQGPRALVEQGIADHRLPRCTVEGAAEWLLGRAPTLEEDPWVDELMGSFIQDQWSYRALTRSILTSETYRRVR